MASPTPLDATGLTTRYQHRAAAGTKDQSVEIRNSRADIAAVVLAFEPLDAAGQPIPDVTVRTLFGSDAGGTLVPATDLTYELLGFSGPGAERVRDVRVEVAGVRWYRDDAAFRNAGFRYELRGAGGAKIGDSALADARQIRITSEATVPVVVSLAYQVLEQAEGDEGAQNAEVVVLVADRVLVPAGETATADLTDDGIAALRQWAGADRYDELVPFLPAEQPALVEVGG